MNAKTVPRIFMMYVSLHGIILSPTDRERFDPVYAFSTEAKDIKSFENLDNLKLVPETNPQVQNISRNKNVKLNIIPNFKMMI